MMEFKQEETSEEAAATKTLESNEEISKEDVEIRKLIHTRRGETTIERQIKKMHQGQEKSEKTGMKPAK